MVLLRVVLLRAMDVSTNRSVPSGGVPRAYTYHLALLPTIAFDCRVALDLLKDVDDETSVFALSSQLPANGYSYIAPLEPRETVRKRFKFARYYRDADFTWAHVAIMLDYMIQAVGSTVGRNKGLKVTASNLTGWLGWARLSDVQDRYPERCQGGTVFEETK